MCFGKLSSSGFYFKLQPESRWQKQKLKINDRPEDGRYDSCQNVANRKIKDLREKKLGRTKKTHIYMYIYIPTTFKISLMDLAYLNISYYCFSYNVGK